MEKAYVHGTCIWGVMFAYYGGFLCWNFTQPVIRVYATTLLGLL